MMHAAIAQQAIVQASFCGFECADRKLRERRDRFLAEIIVVGWVADEVLVLVLEEYFRHQIIDA